MRNKKLLLTFLIITSITLPLISSSCYKSNVNDGKPAVINENELKKQKRRTIKIIKEKIKDAIIKNDDQASEEIVNLFSKYKNDDNYLLNQNFVNELKSIIISQYNEFPSAIKKFEIRPLDITELKISSKFHNPLVPISKNMIVDNFEQFSSLYYIYSINRAKNDSTTNQHNFKFTDDITRLLDFSSNNFIDNLNNLYSFYSLILYLSTYMYARVSDKPLFTDTRDIVPNPNDPSTWLWIFDSDTIWQWYIIKNAPEFETPYITGINDINIPSEYLKFDLLSINLFERKSILTINNDNKSKLNDIIKSMYWTLYEMRSGTYNFNIPNYDLTSLIKNNELKTNLFDAYNFIKQNNHELLNYFQVYQIEDILCATLNNSNDLKLKYMYNFKTILIYTNWLIDYISHNDSYFAESLNKAVANIWMNFSNIDLGISSIDKYFEKFHSEQKQKVLSLLNKIKNHVSDVVEQLNK
ncbi:hypothetical protein [Mycoplasmopsis verecunda]|uniref:Lipoprotein n=1 Tax=Mycoplasmopsis verecunda TaxID=171291 RepID=A0A1T4L0G8_9BACT|nr:hypothetical protein [Mycoplasmopsis verecunda]WPB54412.1 hypothetical protein SAM46_02895 [Mycoplasmopsis verecunda]SJZ48030.1 hypothetical protein SAMN02745154_00263 [Mycoplasmopsis verecunda]